MRKRCGILVAAAGCAAAGLAAEIDLGGTWTLVQADDPSVTCPAAVPGGIYTALYDANLVDMSRVTDFTETFAGVATGTIHVEKEGRDFWRSHSLPALAEF